MSCGVGCRCGLDPALPWPWCGLATVAPIQSLAWELPYATGVALKSKAKNPQKTENQPTNQTKNSNNNNLRVKKIKFPAGMDSEIIGALSGELIISFQRIFHFLIFVNVVISL